MHVQLDTVIVHSYCRQASPQYVERSLDGVDFRTDFGWSLSRAPRQEVIWGLTRAKDAGVPTEPVLTT